MDGTDQGEPAAAPIRLFILDDNEFVRVGLVGLLQDLASDVSVVGQASTARSSRPMRRRWSATRTSIW